MISPLKKRERKREREREREREGVCVGVCERVCERDRENERERVCVCKIELLYSFVNVVNDFNTEEILLLKKIKKYSILLWYECCP